MVSILRGTGKAFAEGMSAFNTFCITVMILSLALFISRSIYSPFYGPSTSEWWTYAADGKTRINHPPLMIGVLGTTLPVGRTLCLRRQVYVHIYKELDTASGGRTWPLQDPGGGDRILLAGCQDRISPSVLPPLTPSAPPPGDYILNVYFVVPRNPFVDLICNGPLIVHLHPVNVRISE